MRVFFAICFRVVEMQRLAYFRDIVQTYACDVSKTKYTKTSNLHMTLQYIGQVDSTGLAHCLKDIGERIIYEIYHSN